MSKKKVKKRTQKTKDKIKQQIAKTEIPKPKPKQEELPQYVILTLHDGNQYFGRVAASSKEYLYVSRPMMVVEQYVKEEDKAITKLFSISQTFANSSVAFKQSAIDVKAYLSTADTISALYIANYQLQLRTVLSSMLNTLTEQAELQKKNKEESKEITDADDELTKEEEKNFEEIIEKTIKETPEKEEPIMRHRPTQEIVDL